MCLEDLEEAGATAPPAQPIYNHDMEIIRKVPGLRLGQDLREYNFERHRAISDVCQCPSLVELVAQLKEQVSALQAKLNAANEYVVRATGASLPYELLFHDKENMVQSDPDITRQSLRLECDSYLGSTWFDAVLSDHNISYKGPQDVEQVVLSRTSKPAAAAAAPFWSPCQSNKRSQKAPRTPLAPHIRRNIFADLGSPACCEEFPLTPRAYHNQTQCSSLDSMYTDAFDLANIAAIPVPD